MTGSSVAEKWKGFDERNQVTEHTVAAAGKTKEAVKEGLSKLSALDEHYEVSKKLQAGVTTGFQTLSGMLRRASGARNGAEAGAPGAPSSAGGASGGGADDLKALEKAGL